MIVFERALHGPITTPARTAAVIALSFLLAILSYHFVERPFRTPNARRLPATRVLRAGFAAILVLVVAGGTIAATGSGWRNYPPEVLRIAAYSDYKGSDRYIYQFGSRDGCQFRESGGYDRVNCLRLAPDRPNYLVVGDSHAGALWRAITLAYPEANVIRATVSGCRPVIAAEGEADCRELFDYVFNDFVPAERLDGIILVGRWRSTDFDELTPTLRHLRRFVPRVVVFGPTVEYEGMFPLLLARERLNGSPETTRNAIDPTKKPLSDALGRLVAAEGATYVPTYDLICPGGLCLETTPDGGPMQFDYGHLTFEGARVVIGRARDRLHLPG